MEACSSSNMFLLLFPLLQVTRESPISTQSHHNSQIIYNQRFTSQLVQLVVHVSLLHTPTHILVNSCIRHVQRVSQKTLSELLFCECGLPLPVKQPTSSGRPGTLKPGFAKRQFKKWFFFGALCIFTTKIYFTTCSARRSCFPTTHSNSEHWAFP